MTEHRDDELQRSLGRIEGQLAELNKAILAHFQDDERNFHAVRQDVSGLQKKFWFASGAGAMLGSFITFLVKGLHN